MQPPQQDFFSLILFLLFTVANGTADDCVQSIVFTNKLAVPATVTATYDVGLLTTVNKGTDVPQEILANKAHTFDKVETTPNSGIYKCIRFIKSDAGGNPATCDVQRIFAVSVVQVQRLELLPTPEAEGASGDSLVGFVKNIHLKNSLTNAAREVVSAQVVATYHTAVLTPSAGGTPDTPVTVTTTHTFVPKAGPSYVRKLVVTATIDGTEYTTTCNVQKRYGSDEVDLKRLEIVKTPSLNIIEVKPRAIIAETDGYVYSAGVKNELLETAAVKAYFSKNVLGEAPNYGVEPVPHNIAHMDTHVFAAVDDPDDAGDKKLPLRLITSLAGGSTAIVKVHDDYAKDKIAKKSFKIVYQTTPGAGSPS